MLATIAASAIAISIVAAPQPPIVLNERVELHWIDDDRAWYRRETSPGRTEFTLIDAETGERGPLFDHALLAERIAESIGRAVDPTRLPIDHLVVTDDALRLLVNRVASMLVADRTTLRLRDAGPDDLASIGRALVTDPGPSRGGGRETALVVHNATDRALRLVWVDTGAAHRPYGVVAPGTTHRQHTFAGHSWLFAVEDDDGDGAILGGIRAERATNVVHIKSLAPVEAPPRQRPRRRGLGTTDSPDQRWRVEIRDHNVVLRDIENDSTRTLTDEATAENAFVPRVFWSPCSTRVVVLRTARGDDRRVHYVEAAPRDQLQPKLHSYAYLKPGDRIAQTFPHLFDVATGREIPLDRTLFENPWSITDHKWSDDGERFTFVYNQRGHQVVRVVAIDRETGTTSALIDEVCETFFDYSNKLFKFDVPSEVSPPNGAIIWMSERDGWNHLFLHDAATGELITPITSGEWVVRGVDRVDVESRRIWFRAMGIHPDQDPYHVHFARIDFDGTNLVLLTDGDGTHEIEPSPDGRHLVARHSRVDLPPVTELRCAETGSLRLEIERAELADRDRREASTWRMPTRFVATGRDGVTDIHGMILWPRGYDGTTTHPVIESIYAGPHGAHVPKTFRTRYGHQGELTDAGFIVVMIDGMGTNWRSKAFHDHAWRNLADAGFPDRIAWIRAAAQEHPSMDLERVGIYGGSAGGQNAMRALIDHHDFYKVAVADCGCHDNRMDKIWWNEAWMGWPVGEWYEASSNVVHAHRMEGKLLLIVGEKDQNVDPASTTQVVDALIRADKDFDFLLIPGAGHGAAETPYGRRKRQEFFERHLKIQSRTLDFDSPPRQ